MSRLNQDALRYGEGRRTPKNWWSMKRKAGILLCLAMLLLSAVHTGGVPADDGPNEGNPPFGLTSLSPMGTQEARPREDALYAPKNPYNILINYELGMHCVSFDISYCCIIPPYNSVQAQAIQSGRGEGLPRLLAPVDGVGLSYEIRDNTYSEGNKMKYWQILKDVRGDGAMDSPGDNMANYVWDHLFIYRDLAGTKPQNASFSQRRHIGKEIPVNIDSGPSGKAVSGGPMEYAGADGGNIVFTDSLMADIKDVPLRLTASHLWDALGLPLTAFNDSRRRGSIRTVSEKDFQPYQYASVQMHKGDGSPLTVQGKPIEFFGTNPVDISNCSLCHSGQGVAASLSRGAGLFRFDKEYAYWKTKYPDTSEFMARLSAASINVLELHDKRHGTNFLRAYDPDAASNRLGRVGAVNCPDCHGDNISGNIQSPRPGTTGYGGFRAGPLTEAIYSVHARLIRMPDKAGRTQNCQAYYPTHWQNEKMNEPSRNPYRITDEFGNPRFSSQDLRTAGGGCFLRRDAHTNPDVSPPFFLNEIGKWYLHEVSMRDEVGGPVARLRGLYCTNCHNHLTHELYRYDDFVDPVRQEGRTLRSKPIDEVVAKVAGGDRKRFKEFFADPIVGAQGEPLYDYYANHRRTPLARAVKGEDGKLKLLPWNADKGEEVMYRAVSGGSDWWLSPGVPHCANCHIAPLVESGGGKYFPMDHQGKYALYRYSKAHGVIACQSCHESMHGLYPVRYGGPEGTVDLTSHGQALQFSPDGKYAGPVTCAACHTVNGKGVPVQLKGTRYYNDYWPSVVLIHFMREGDQKLPIADLLRKYPYEKARGVVARGWK